MRSSILLAVVVCALLALVAGLGEWMKTSAQHRRAIHFDGARPQRGPSPAPDALVPDAELMREAPRAPETSRTVVQDEAAAPADASPSTGVLLVTVLGDSGEPLEGASARLSAHDPAQAAALERYTDDRGCVRFSGLASGSYRLEVDARGFVPHAAPDLALLGRETLELTVPLVRGTFVDGRVVTAAGTPVAGAWVQAWPRLMASRSNRQGAASAETDADGFYRLGPIGPGLHVLTAEHPEAGYAEVPKLRVPVPEQSGGVLHQDLRMEPGQVLLGRVTTKSGAPLAGALVRLRGGVSPVRERETDGEGRFRFERLPEETYRLKASLDGFLPATLTARITGFTTATERELVLAACVPVRGRVIDAATEAPIESFELEVWSVATRNGRSKRRVGLPRRVLDPRGEFRIEDLEFADYVVRVTAPGHHSAESEVVRLREGVEGPSLTLALAVGGVLHGSVVELRSGQPIAGAEVRLVGLGRASARPLGADEQATRTGNDGRYRLASLPPGAHLLQVSHPDYVSLRTERFEVEANAEPILVPQVQLQRGAVLEGEVLSEAGGTSAFALELRRVTDEPGGAVLRRDLGSRYSFASLPPGAYRLSVRVHDPSRIGGAAREVGALEVFLAEGAHHQEDVFVTP